MINDYLKYVTEQRKLALERMVYYGRFARGSSWDWSIGYYEGHSQAARFEAHHWRRLQKDIQARSAEDACIAWFNDGVGMIIQRLS